MPFAHRTVLAALAAFAATAGLAGLSAAAHRARDLGVPFDGCPGPWNAITDVTGVEVGYVTLERGKGAKAVYTGVTAVFPRGRTAASPVFAGCASLNGNGEMTGIVFVEEFGRFNGPILLTNTDSVGTARDAAIAWQLKQPAFKDAVNELPIVAETWDGCLNDIYGFHVKPEHVLEALNSARTGPIAEGNVGGGTGMVCHQFKGGTGTASRKLKSGYTVGVLLQANYGLRDTLTIAGVPVGREIPVDREHAQVRPNIVGRSGSIIVIVGTDAPLLAPSLKAMAKRVTVGLARVGGLGETSSGDLFIAFSTANDESGERTATTRQVTLLTDERIVDQLYQATAQATEEAIVNALVAAETRIGLDGHPVPSLPHKRLQELLRNYNRLAPPGSH